ncbi:hypothetical protein C7S14_1679 [Burkholderia cepacia]|nr:hypothetical protein C7S14_1679 [Burkholderia cepacia]
MPNFIVDAVTAAPAGSLASRVTLLAQPDRKPIVTNARAA